jgi:DNA polymerase I
VSREAAAAVIEQFREVVAVDFEFTALPGERPGPVCLVAHELRSGRRFRVFQDEFGPAPPYATGKDVLFVGYYSSAELGCYRVLGWPMPQRILDLFVEFRNLTNMGSKLDQARRTPFGAGLLGALIYFGLDPMDAAEKKELQQAIGGGTWQGRYTPTEILDYCETDVVALERLLPLMLPQIDLPRALLRGRYMAAAAAMEHNGVPIDVERLARLRERWTGIQDELIRAVDTEGIYVGRTFKAERWAKLMAAQGIPWPLLESGQLNLSDDTFRQMAKSYPVVSPYRELRHSLSELRLNDLQVGRDGCNRTVLSAFRSRTGRNQPSNTKYIFGPSVWLRGLIKPPSGHAVAYIDWSQQEVGIAAVLSGDSALLEAYRSGDFYLTFGKQAGAIPADATKATHASQRELFKQCVLATQYGQGEIGLAQRIGKPRIVARDLLRAYRETYRVSVRWSDAVVDTAMLTGSLYTVFGWQVHVGENPNPRSLRNFPMQANAAEMMRLAACPATERGIEVCAPVHDAFLICARLDRIEADVAAMRAAMAEASRVVLKGFELATDVHITRYPDRYMDARGAVMWERVMRLLQQQDQMRMTA